MSYVTYVGHGDICYACPFRFWSKYFWDGHMFCLCAFPSFLPPPSSKVSVLALIFRKYPCLTFVFGFSSPVQSSAPVISVSLCPMCSFLPSNSLYLPSVSATSGLLRDYHEPCYPMSIARFARPISWSNMSISTRLCDVWGRILLSLSVDNKSLFIYLKGLLIPFIFRFGFNCCS